MLNSLNKPKLDLSDILKLFKKLKVSKELLEERNGKGVCFIFDGLDEFSPQDGRNSIVYKIIDRDYLDKSTVIVASRPAGTAPLRSKASKVVEVLGFLNNQILEYFDHYPFSDESKLVELKNISPITLMFFTCATCLFMLLWWHIYMMSLDTYLEQKPRYILTLLI